MTKLVKDRVICIECLNSCDRMNGFKYMYSEICLMPTVSARAVKPICDF